MAKYDITHTCGHTSTHNLVGPEASRSSRRAWLADQACIACRNAAELAAVEDDGLPALDGSEKQVAWARTIRAKIAADVMPQRAKIEAIKAKCTLSAAQHAAIDVALSAIHKIMGQAKASWWIDNQSVQTYGRTLVAEQITGDDATSKSARMLITRELANV